MSAMGRCRTADDITADTITSNTISSNNRNVDDNTSTILHTGLR